MPRAAFFRLSQALGIDVLVPFLHDIFILVADDEIVNHSWVTLPENLNPV